MAWAPASVRTLAELVMLHHSVFALPFALLAVLLAAQGRPDAWTLSWVLAAMVSARTAAMAYNRLADHGIDAANPRTAGRHLPMGKVRRKAVGFLVVGSSLLFLLAAGMLNRLCLTLAPVALAVLLGYSHAKRFTWASHFWLGLSLAMAPVGGWLAVKAEWSALPLWIGGGVMLWTAGFDILYSLQDVEFDRIAGLHSLPVRVGLGRAITLARGLHVATVVVLGAAAWVGGLGGWYLGGVAVTGVLLVVEHRLVRPTDLRRIDQAFFSANAAISVVMLIAVLGEVYG